MILKIGISVQTGHRKTISEWKDMMSQEHWIERGAMLTWLWKYRHGMMTSSSIGEVKKRHPFKVREGKGRKAQVQEMGKLAQSWKLAPVSHLRHSMGSFALPHCSSKETRVPMGVEGEGSHFFPLADEN